MIQNFVSKTCHPETTLSNPPPTCTERIVATMKCSSELEPESIQRMGNSKFISGFNFARLCVSAHIKLLRNATRAIGGVIRNALRVLLLISSLLSNERNDEISGLRSALFEK
ncbi:hypothetical protein CDAR_61831 [Caerostris darwini]|uniref:Uncharacterized protein n=1 Tax=Caerostris darwini TaxID=1538125 RepID=A0AAV4VJ69_9ARAC|nr:hypothetical protein CDAR_61831 [Caerostris darwini]